MVLCCHQCQNTAINKITDHLLCFKGTPNSATCYGHLTLPNGWASLAVELGTRLHFFVIEIWHRFVWSISYKNRK